MRAVVQRVTTARVTVGGDLVSEIGPGLCVLVGVTHTDTTATATRLAAKLAGLRLFDDDHAGLRGPNAVTVMNRSVLDTDGAVLIVSQFTLYGDTSRGRRPSWSAAAPAAIAEPLVEAVAEALRAHGVPVATGRFGASMHVELVNDGPVTVLVET